MAEEKKENNDNAQAESNAAKQRIAGVEKEAKEEKKDESNELKERIARLAAEFDNYKKRTAKEIENAKNMGKAEFASRMIPILDEIELAIESLEMKSEKEKGIALVFSNMLDVMKKEGLKEIESSGRSDPYRHEVILARESEKEPGTILEVVRKGYTFNGIMLRPASVIVSTKAKEEIKK